MCTNFPAFNFRLLFSLLPCTNKQSVWRKRLLFRPRSLTLTYYRMWTISFAYWKSSMLRLIDWIDMTNVSDTDIVESVWVRVWVCAREFVYIGFVFFTFEMLSVFVCVYIEKGLAFDSNIMLDKLYHWYNFKTFAFPYVKLLYSLQIFINNNRKNRNVLRACGCESKPNVWMRTFVSIWYQIWWPKFRNKSKIYLHQTNTMSALLNVNNHRQLQQQNQNDDDDGNNNMNTMSNVQRRIKSPPHWFQWCFNRYCLVISSHWKPSQRIR